MKTFEAKVGENQLFTLVFFLPSRPPLFPRRAFAIVASIDHTSDNPTPLGTSPTTFLPR